jgi:hypothetical protein
MAFPERTGSGVGQPVNACTLPALRGRGRGAPATRVRGVPREHPGVAPLADLSRKGAGGVHVGYTSTNETVLDGHHHVGLFD